MNARAWRDGHAVSWLLVARPQSASLAGHEFP